MGTIINILIILKKLAQLVILIPLAILMIAIVLEFIKQSRNSGRK